jgi:hypothetical protein
MIAVQKTRKNMAITGYIRNADSGILNTVFENTFRRVNNVWRLAEDTLAIPCNFMYCNHQVHRDFFIILYLSLLQTFGQLVRVECANGCWCSSEVITVLRFSPEPNLVYRLYSNILHHFSNIRLHLALV